MSYADGEERPESAAESRHAPAAEAEETWARHARTETIPAWPETGWGFGADARRRRRRTAFARLVAIGLALVTALVLSLVLVFNRPPPGPAGPGADQPPPPGEVVPPVAGGTTSARSNARVTDSEVTRPPSRAPASAVLSATTDVASSPTPSPSPKPVAPTSYEAEAPTNVLASGARVDLLGGASGGKAVYAIGAPNLGTLRFTGVTAPATRTYTMTIYYQNPWQWMSRTAMISVNGAAPVSMQFASTGTCCIGTRTMPVTLNGGSANTVEFGNPNSRAPDIDRIVIAE